jgi:ACS family glucarate transporter-like MFS transporter
VSAAELTAIQSGLRVTGDSPNLGKESADIPVPWKRVLRSREVWAVTVSYFCYGYVAWIFFSWQKCGLDLKASAFYSMLPFLAMLVCCLLGGAVNDRLTKWRGPRLGRCGLAAFAMGVAGIFIACGSQV